MVMVLGVERNVVEKVRGLASNRNILGMLVESLAPDIYGLKTVKEAVLYALLGGVSDENEGHRKRE